MINDRYYVKIVPQRGDTVHRFEVRRRHMWAVVAFLGFLILGSFVFAGVQVLRAHMQVAALQQQADRQKETLETINARTDALSQQLQHVQKQNQEIKRAIGIGDKPASKVQKTSFVRAGSTARGGSTLDGVAARVSELTSASDAIQQESDHDRTLAMRVLNMQHLRDLARAQLIAAIPSIDPVAGAAVVGCFCYRTYPDVEFHKGVDIEADYGTPVRASAAGTVVANTYDGAYGIKVDIDHGNGYHTWYAHLSRVDVSVGQHVYKGENIAAAGATGFATGPHLHYQVMYNDEAIDPTPFLSGVPANVLASLP
ncbi:MAG TPA: peptidoglycan DD-metalloendopeptidase family protein [Candidatus Acidoferrales bacterium]|jgi:murein DD-endopeptidase MepM/ murein hydrolase activator NlpD|nr:peptidoglycan DD-metalloendopeptidase family protein [Candidatus Acidoferrales bacterium]